MHVCACVDALRLYIRARTHKHIYIYLPFSFCFAPYMPFIVPLQERSVLCNHRSCGLAQRCVSPPSPSLFWFACFSGTGRIRTYIHTHVYVHVVPIHGFTEVYLYLHLFIVRVSVCIRVFDWLCRLVGVSVPCVVPR